MISAGAVVEPVDVGDQVVPGVDFALLLEAAVQVAAVHVDALHLLAVQRGDDLDRPVGRRVRRPDVDDDRVVALAASNAGRTGLGSGAMSTVGLVMSGRARAAAPASSVVLAQRVTDEAFVEQDRTQVGLAAKDDAVHVVALALHEARRAVQRDERVHGRVVLRNARLQPDADMCVVE